MIRLYVLLSLFITPALLAAPTVDVPMLFSGTRPAVPVRVNGQGPFLFLLDTERRGPRGSIVRSSSAFGSNRKGSAMRPVDGVSVLPLELREGNPYVRSSSVV